MMVKNAYALSILLIVVVGLFCLSAPLFISAQESDEDVLRNEIRTSLLSDPRAKDLSEKELSEMVELLVGEAAAQEVTQDFVPARVPIFIQEFIAPITTPWGQPISPALLYAIVLTTLAGTIVLLRQILVHHKRMSC